MWAPGNATRPQIKVHAEFLFLSSFGLLGYIVKVIAIATGNGSQNKLDVNKQQPLVDYLGY